MPVDDLVLDPMRWMGPTALTLDSSLFIILFFSFDNHRSFVLLLCGNDRLVMFICTLFLEREWAALLKMRSRPDGLPRYRKCCTATYYQSSVVLCKGEEPLEVVGW